MFVVYYLFMALFLFTAVLLSFVILMQEGKSSGFGASFGGGGDVGDSFFGTSTPAILTKITAWLAAIFFAGCLLLSIWTASIGSSKSFPSFSSIEEVSD